MLTSPLVVSVIICNICQGATRGERCEKQYDGGKKAMQITMTHNKREVSEAFRDALKRKQQTIISSTAYLLSWGGRTAECSSRPSKSAIIDTFEVAEVVKNGNVSFGESVGSKKLESFFM
jgi:hypothetical protein